MLHYQPCVSGLILESHVGFETTTQSQNIKLLSQQKLIATVTVFEGGIPCDEMGHSVLPELPWYKNEEHTHPPFPLMNGFLIIRVTVTWSYTLICAVNNIYSAFRLFN